MLTHVSTDIPETKERNKTQPSPNLTFILFFFFNNKRNENISMGICLYAFYGIQTQKASLKLRVVREKKKRKTTSQFSKFIHRSSDTIRFDTIQ